MIGIEVMRRLSKTFHGRQRIVLWQAYDNHYKDLLQDFEMSETTDGQEYESLIYQISSVKNRFFFKKTAKMVEY